MQIDKILILNKLMTHKGFTIKADFARYIGVSPQCLAKWYERNSFDVDKIVNAFPDVSKSWLLTGEGAMLCQPSRAPSPQQGDEQTVTMSREVFELISSQQQTIALQQHTIDSAQKLIVKLNDRE